MILRGRDAAGCTLGRGAIRTGEVRSRPGRQGGPLGGSALGRAGACSTYVPHSNPCRSCRGAHHPLPALHAYYTYTHPHGMPILRASIHSVYMHAGLHAHAHAHACNGQARSHLRVGPRVQQHCSLAPPLEPDAPACRMSNAAARAGQRPAPQLAKAWGQWTRNLPRTYGMHVVRCAQYACLQHGYARVDAASQSGHGATAARLPVVRARAAPDGRAGKR